MKQNKDKPHTLFINKTIYMIAKNRMCASCEFKKLYNKFYDIIDSHSISECIYVSNDNIGFVNEKHQYYLIFKKYLK